MVNNIINLFIKRLSVLLILIFSIFLIFDLLVFKKDDINTITDKVTITSILGDNYNVDTVLYGSLQQSDFFRKHNIKKKSSGIFTLSITSNNIQESEENQLQVKTEIRLIENRVHSILKNYNTLQLLKDDSTPVGDIGFFIINNNRNFLFLENIKYQKSEKTLGNIIIKYCYLMLLSLFISLFILYFLNLVNKKRINKILNKFI